MARNQSQFQKGMSLARFQRLYGTQEQCHEALVKMRWPGGFVCPRCGERRHSFCKPKRVFPSNRAANNKRKLISQIN